MVEIPFEISIQLNVGISLQFRGPNAKYSNILGCAFEPM